MNQQIQTAKFVIAAAVSVALASGTWFFTRPTPVEGFGRVGEEFFPELKPSEATALMVVEFEEKQASVREFTVEKVDDVWRLPSYSNYPADGEKQLGKTTTSLLGVARDALVSRVKADHSRLGVVDPLARSGELEGRGKRITIFRNGGIEKGTRMADLIIGNKVPDRDGDYYVRIPDGPDQDFTYIAKLDINLSTKFSDWVEADLLKFDRDNLVRLEARRATPLPDGSASEATEALLTRERFSDPWVLAGLDDTKEEVNQDDLRAMVNVLDNLKLSGIRKRPVSSRGRPLLTNDLTLDVSREESRDQLMMRAVLSEVQQSLDSTGFQPYQVGDSGDLRLASEGGELVASTHEGVQYWLNFGRQFEGTAREIEIGRKDETAEKKDADADAGKAAGPAAADGSEDAPADADGDKSDAETDKPANIKSRYVFVRAMVDETLLGDPLFEPEKPAVPEGVKVDDDGNVIDPPKADSPANDAPKADAPGTEAAAGDAAESTTEKPDDEQAQDSVDAAEVEAAAPVDPKPAGDDAGPADAEPSTEDAKAAEASAPADETKPADDAKPMEDPVVLYKQALEKYRKDVAQYGRDVKEREQKVNDAKKKVEELNDRFAAWYYVITEEDYGKLLLTRDRVVKVKEAAADPAAGTDPAAAPDSPEGTQPPTKDDDAAKPAADDAAKPEAEPAKPESDPAKPDATDAAKPKAEAEPAKEPASPEAKPEPAGGDKAADAAKPADDAGDKAGDSGK